MKHFKITRKERDNMKWENVVELTQKAVAQALGTSYMEQSGDLGALNTEKLIDIGKKVLDVDATTEKFTKALISVIGEYELITFNVKAEYDDLFIHNFEWGGFLERIYYGLADVIEDPMWNTVNGRSYADIENKFYQPSVTAKIFDECKASMVPISIQRDTLKEAFKGEAEWNKYISGIHKSIQNTIKIVKKAYARMLISAAIAISDKGTETSVHLITEAIAEGILPSGSTVADALASEDFLAYMCKRIATVRDYMKVESTAFNNGTVIASGDDVRLKVLSDIAKTIRFNLRADTYNENLLSFGDYKEVVSWQGVTDGTNSFNIVDLSAIKIGADANNKLGIGTDAVNINYCVAFAYDYRAIGFTIDKLKITSNYTACADFWNEFTHIWTNAIIDTNLPMVAFILD